MGHNNTLLWLNTYVNKTEANNLQIKQYLIWHKTSIVISSFKTENIKIAVFTTWYICDNVFY